jgi:hypothetical protein
MNDYILRARQKRHKENKTTTKNVRKSQGISPRKLKKNKNKKT